MAPLSPLQICLTSRQTPARIIKTSSTFNPKPNSTFRTQPTLITPSPRCTSHSQKPSIRLRHLLSKSVISNLMCFQPRMSPRLNMSHPPKIWISNSLNLTRPKTFQRPNMFLNNLHRKLSIIRSLKYTKARISLSHTSLSLLPKK